MIAAGRRSRPRALGVAFAAAAALAAGNGCKGPHGPVVHLTIIADRDPEVVVGIHEVSVTLALLDEPDTEVLLPPGGPPPTPLSFPTDVNLVLTGKHGDLNIIVVGRDVNGVVVARGVTQVTLDKPRLYQATVTIGVTSTCRDDKNTDGEVCLTRDAELTTGNIANGVIFYDFDGAGATDILVAYGGDNLIANDHSGVSLILGSNVPGAGASYDTVIDLADTTLRGNIEVAVADFVGRNDPLAPPYDPDPDFFNDIIASARSANEITVWPGRGDNTFDDPVTLPVGEEPGEIHTADFLGTSAGREVFVEERELQELHILGHPVAAMPPAELTPSSPVPVGVGARGFEIIDLDGDLDLDLVVSAKGVTEAMVPGELSVHLNDGSGVFAAPVVVTTEMGLRDVAVLDLDGDGVFDLATVNEDNGMLATWHGTSATTFDAPVSYLLYPTSAEPERIRVGDLDGNGVPDLFACDRALGSVFVLMMDATGVPIEPPVRVMAGAAQGLPAVDMQGCDIADTSGDGVIDRVVIVERSTNTVRVLRTNP
jgi:hypothetical protein